MMEKQKCKKLFNETCCFCCKTRCLCCEKRTSMLPSIILLLVKNGFVKDARMLGALACSCKMLEKFVCVDSDEDIWATLLHQKWPSTRMMSQDVHLGLSNRTWYERIATAVYRGLMKEEEFSKFEAEFFKHEEEIRSRQEWYRHELSSSNTNDAKEDNEEKMPPLEWPSTDFDDLFLLFDVFSDEQHVVSAALSLEESNNINAYGRVSENLIRATPIEVGLYDKYGSLRGEFQPITPNFNCRVYLIRLTDYKIICLHHTVKFEWNKNQVGPLARRKPTAHLCLQGNKIGCISTLLSSRILDHNSNRFMGFGSYDIYLNVVLPRSPGDFGHEFIEMEYKERLANGTWSSAPPSLNEFRQAYFGVSAWDKISSFCDQSESEGSKDGRYFADVTCIELCPLHVFQPSHNRILPMHHQLCYLLDYNEPDIHDESLNL
mmetsp:Transcript_22074/g.33710  ORF Transcript_22074/g.33710 Transcript_22074/m.33710 type:complete len:433 (+) Transcript_22074:4356-5654(+)